MTRADEEAKILYQKLIDDPNMKLTSATLAATRAIRTYARYLRDKGNGAQDIYKELINRFGYSSSGAKIIVADTFFDLE